MLDICLLYQKHLCMLYTAVLATKEQHSPSAQTWNLSPEVLPSSSQNSCVALYFKSSFNPKGLNLEKPLRPGSGGGMAFGTMTGSLPFGALTASGALPGSFRNGIFSNISCFDHQKMVSSAWKDPRREYGLLQPRCVCVGGREAKRC